MNPFENILNTLETAQNIVITAHKSPDGDSIGSSMALFHWLMAKGKAVSVCHPDAFPNFLSWVPSVQSILNFEESATLISEKMEQADLIFALDYNHPSRLGKDMEPLLADKRSKTIMIDHHLDPSDFAFLAVSEPSVCSTAQLVYELMKSDKKTAIPVESGTCVYLGIMTDTGSFRFNSVEPRTHTIASELLELGVDHTAIHEAVFGQNSLNQLRLRSHAICNNLELIAEGKVALMWLSAQELVDFHYEKGDTEGLVNVALSVTGVKLAVFMIEKDGKVKMSFRSKENQVVNTYANTYFEGGGHAYAAGGISDLSLSETLEKVKNTIGKYIV